MFAQAKPHQNKVTGGVHPTRAVLRVFGSQSHGGTLQTQGVPHLLAHAPTCCRVPPLAAVCPHLLQCAPTCCHVPLQEGAGNGYHFFDLDIRDVSHHIHFFNECQQYLMAQRSRFSAVGDNSTIQDTLSSVGSHNYNFLSGEEVRVLASHFKGSMLQDPSLAFESYGASNPGVNLGELTERMRSFLSGWGSTFQCVACWCWCWVPLWLCVDIVCACTAVLLSRSAMVSSGGQGIFQPPSPSAWWSTRTALGGVTIGSWSLWRHCLTPTKPQWPAKLQTPSKCNQAAPPKQHKGGLPGCTGHPTRIIWSKCPCNPERQ